MQAASERQAAVWTRASPRSQMDDKRTATGGAGTRQQASDSLGASEAAKKRNPGTHAGTSSPLPGGARALGLAFRGAALPLCSVRARAAWKGPLARQDAHWQRRAASALCGSGARGVSSAGPGLAGTLTRAHTHIHTHARKGQCGGVALETSQLSSCHLPSLARHLHGLTQHAARRITTVLSRLFVDGRRGRCAPQQGFWSHLGHPLSSTHGDKHTGTADPCLSPCSGNSGCCNRVSACAAALIQLSSLSIAIFPTPLPSHLDFHLPLLFCPRTNLPLSLSLLLSLFIMLSFILSIIIIVILRALLGNETKPMVLRSATAAGKP